MANKSKAAEDQKLISGLMSDLDIGLAAYDMETAAYDCKPPKFKKHDGYTYSIQWGDKRIELKLSVIDKDKTNG